MGDKGGKKDKSKHQKQHDKKQQDKTQHDKEKGIPAKQPKPGPLGLT